MFSEESRAQVYISFEKHLLACDAIVFSLREERRRCFG